MDLKIRKNSNIGNIRQWPAVTIDFQDLVYTVPDAIENKVILKNISGKFKANQLSAILGPSGAGKSSLLNILAGYKHSGVTGTININGAPRNLQTFKEMSRYIMQNDIYQPFLTVTESMNYSADLKIGQLLPKFQKKEDIKDLLDLLSLTKSKDTMCDKLSGGERKRLSIALELVNNPPVLFLDEPTTGLDDLSASQCIALLRRIAHGGRTIICSIHTPSAKMLAMFDCVYIVASGQCVYQGAENHIIPYVQSIGLNCPLTYNPADFIVDVASGEYGHDFVEKMVSSVNNGKLSWYSEDNEIRNLEDWEEDVIVEEVRTNCLQSNVTWSMQFKILLKRTLIQTYRDYDYLKLQVFVNIFLALCIGCLFLDTGNDASKAFLNIELCLAMIYVFTYIPMTLVAMKFPQEVQLLRREHFNRWFNLTPYYFATIVAKLPLQLFLRIIAITIVYFLSNQPLEWNRIGMFYSTILILTLTAEGFGMIFGTRLNVVNSLFLGSVCSVPLLLLSMSTLGYPRDEKIPIFVQILKRLSYPRYGAEALIESLYGYNRAIMPCPAHTFYCPFTRPSFLVSYTSFQESNYFLSIIVLCIFYMLFNGVAYYLLKRRLERNNFIIVEYVQRFVKKYLIFSS